MADKILFTETQDVSLEVVNFLRSGGFEVELKDVSYEDLKLIIGDYCGVFIKLGIEFDKELLEKSNLKFIATPTTGLDHIDLDFAKVKGIEVISLRGEVEFLSQITPTAELAIGLMLSLLRRIPFAFDSVKKGVWDRDLFVGSELKGKTLGIVGLGRLGLMVANICSAFSMRVAYYDPNVTHDNFEKISSLKDLFTISDVVSLHVHLTEENKFMINSEILENAKQNLIIVNTSRGDIVVESDILSALNSSKIAGYATDVLSGELGSKTISSEMIDYSKNHDNVVITPHIGGACEDSMHITQMFIAKKIIRVLKQ